MNIKRSKSIKSIFIRINVADGRDTIHNQSLLIELEM